MPVIKHNPKELFPQYRCYSHAIEIHGDSRLLLISGLNGYLSDGITMPESFENKQRLSGHTFGRCFDRPEWICRTWCRFAHTLRTLSTMKRTYVCALNFWVHTNHHQQ
jgi:hypothetical protein